MGLLTPFDSHSELKAVAVFRSVAHSASVNMPTEGTKSK